MYAILCVSASWTGCVHKTTRQSCFLWPWAPRMRCLNNDKASLTWLVIQNALWVGKKLFTVLLAIFPECIWCGALGVSIEHAFFHCLVVQLLCRLLEGYMVCILGGKFFCPGSQFCVQQCGTEVEQAGTLCE